VAWNAHTKCALIGITCTNGHYAEEQLRPEFRNGLTNLLKLLFSRCQPKMVGREVLTGRTLAGMATQYVAAINGGAVPTIATAWQSVAEAGAYNRPLFSST